MRWDSDATEILYNPRLPLAEREAAFAHLPSARLDGHLWLSTSGSTGHIKWVALSKKAILASAKAVNEFLESSASDRWLSCLPLFHVAGLGIEARAHLSQAKVYTLETWDPQRFTYLLFAHKITLTTLVPSQVFDLVQLKLRPPPSLRGIVVGGARLQPQLYEQARQLSWPVLPSYGMTETASQIATAAHPDDPRLILLPHVKAQNTSTGHLQIESPCLFTAYAHLYGPTPFFQNRPSPFITEDKVTLEGSQLIVHGREANFIKIGGECVDLLRLERIFEEAKLKNHYTGDAVLVAMEDERLGHVIHLAATGPDLEALLASYHASVNPFEKIRRIHMLHEIPRSPLRKLLLADLKNMLKEG